MNLLNQNSQITTDEKKEEQINNSFGREALTTESAVVSKLKKERRKADKERYAQRSADWKDIKKQIDNYSIDELLNFINNSNPHEPAIGNLSTRVSPYEFSLLKAASLISGKSIREIIVKASLEYLTNNIKHNK